VLNRDLIVPADSTLTIDPGFEVRLGPGVRLVVMGTLVAQGNPAAPIRMIGTTGGWEQVMGLSGSTIVLEHVQLRQAGSAGTAISSTDGKLIVRNSSLRESAGGIVARGSVVELRNSELHANTIAGPVVNIQTGPQATTTLIANLVGGNDTPAGAPQVLIHSPAAAGLLTVEGNTIISSVMGTGFVLNNDAVLHGAIRCNSFQNGTIGLQIGTQHTDLAGFHLTIDNNAFAGQERYGATGPLAFNVANNWWDAASGPVAAGRNSNGTGVSVGINLLFQPWLAARPACAPAQ
jgi:hypothetical protein